MLNFTVGFFHCFFFFQFDALHTRGSSHGCSRITRRAYEQPYYVSMMDEAFKLWAQIEEESGTELYMYVVILQKLTCSVIFETVLASI